MLLAGDAEACRDILALYREIDLDDLGAQLKIFRQTRPVGSVSEAVQILQQMVPEVKAEFVQVCQLIRILLVSPASSASQERSFSALRRLKTWLRTTMTELRLNCVAVCNVHKSVIDTVDVRSLMTQFISCSDIRKSMFGKFT